MGEAVVTRRIVTAAIVTLGLGAGAWAYEAWPSWRGQEITLQGMVGPKDARSGRASIEFAATHLKADVPGAHPDDSPVPFHVVRQIGPVWPAGDDAVRTARLMHGRVVYVQARHGQGAAPQPGAAYVQSEERYFMPVSVSTTPVEGAINLRVRVSRAEPTGRFEIALAPPMIPIPPGLDETAFVSVVLRVLPSGRHTIVRIEQR
jgi:hypothetical protein